MRPVLTFFAGKGSDLPFANASTTISRAVVSIRAPSAARLTTALANEKQSLLLRGPLRRWPPQCPRRPPLGLCSPPCRSGGGSRSEAVAVAHVAVFLRAYPSTICLATVPALVAMLSSLWPPPPLPLPSLARGGWSFQEGDLHSPRPPWAAPQSPPDPLPFRVCRDMLHTWCREPCRAF